MDKKYVEIFKIEVSSVKGVAGLSNIFGSTTKMMENSEFIGGVIDLPKIFTAIPGKDKLDFIKMIRQTGSNITSMSENVLMDKSEINKTLESLKNIELTKDKIIGLYSKDLPAIKNITEKTASIIDNLNETKGRTLTIKEIRALHTECGKKVEYSPNQDDLNDYKALRDVVDDINHAKLVQKQDQAHEKALENPLSKSKNIEMVQ